MNFVDFATQHRDLSDKRAGDKNWNWSDGVRNKVSTCGMSWRFMPASWNSYSKSLTARSPDHDAATLGGDEIPQQPIKAEHPHVAQGLGTALAISMRSAKVNKVFCGDLPPRR